MADSPSRDSRNILNEQFAASRREFEFDEDEEVERPEQLEPAPIIADLSGILGPEVDEDIYDDDLMMRQLLDANDVETSFDYYALLGLTRDPPPTTAEIRKAYHRVSLAFHPDKQPHSSKAAAEMHFTRLQKAYETLIEPRKRVIYDLEGAEGLRMEYSSEGAMGKDGEAEMGQIGVKTMDAAEFKRWFIGILKERERRAIEGLVGANCSYKMTISAVKLFDGSPRIVSFQPLDNEGPEIEFQVPLVSLTAVQLKQDFSMPLPALAQLLQAPLNHLIFIRDGTEEQIDDSPPLTWDKPVPLDVPKLSFLASIGGELENRIIVQENDGKQASHTPVHWYSLSTDSISLSARLDHSFPEVVKQKTGSITSLLQGTDLDITSGILPRRTFDVGLGRMFSIVQNTRPFYGYMRTSFDDSPYTRPPVIDVRISRSLGDKHTGYCQWSSGDQAWPLFIQEVMPVSKLGLWLPRGRLAQTARIGWTWNEGRSRLDSDEYDERSGDKSTSEAEGRPTSNQSLHVSTTASPNGASLSVTYGRDVFARPNQYTVRSRILNSGEAVQKSNRPRAESSGVLRLEIEGEVSLALSVGGIVRGVRRVGDFSSVGLGVGLNAERGLYLSLSWARLSQRLSLPIILVPAEAVSTKAFVWAVALPSAAYAIIEWGILRPRLQRKRLRLIAQQRRRLHENVVKRKQEAEQAIMLMLPVVEQRQAIERDTGGLIILRAQYGVAEPGKRKKALFHAGETADVTVAVAALIDNGQLSLPRGLHKSLLVGWWDPAPLKKKTLSIDYVFGDKQHHVEVRENSGVSIPMRDHEL